MAAAKHDDEDVADVAADVAADDGDNADDDHSESDDDDIMIFLSYSYHDIPRNLDPGVPLRQSFS